MKHKAIIGANGELKLESSKQTKVTVINGDKTLEKKSHLRTSVQLSIEEMTNLEVEIGDKVEVILPERGL